MTTERRVLSAVVLAGLIATGVLIFFVVARLGNNGTQINHNQNALTYICSTTNILDVLVVQVRDQIDANFENGTYAKLLKQGVISEENIVQAHLTRTRYQQAHLKLKGNGACRELEGE